MQASTILTRSSLKVVPCPLPSPGYTQMPPQSSEHTFYHLTYANFRGKWVFQLFVWAVQIQEDMWGSAQQAEHPCPPRTPKNGSVWGPAGLSVKIWHVGQNNQLSHIWLSWIEAWALPRVCGDARVLATSPFMTNPIMFSQKNKSMGLNGQDSFILLLFHSNKKPDQSL